jgi:hypothetical protein
MATDPELREQALGRIKKRRDLGNHVVVFVLVNAALWALWAVTATGYPWPAWVTGLWGIGLATNTWDVYGRRPITEADIRHEMDRLRPQH